MELNYESQWFPQSPSVQQNEGLLPFTDTFHKRSTFTSPTIRLLLLWPPHLRRKRTARSCVIEQLRGSSLPTVSVSYFSNNRYLLLQKKQAKKLLEVHLILHLSFKYVTKFTLRLENGRLTL